MVYERERERRETGREESSWDVHYHRESWTRLCTRHRRTRSFPSSFSFSPAQDWRRRDTRRLPSALNETKMVSISRHRKSNTRLRFATSSGTRSFSCPPRLTLTVRELTCFRRDIRPVSADVPTHGLNKQFIFSQLQNRMDNLYPYWSSFYAYTTDAFM